MDTQSVVTLVSSVVTMLVLTSSSLRGELKGWRETRRAPERATADAHGGAEVQASPDVAWGILVEQAATVRDLRAEVEGLQCELARARIELDVYRAQFNLEAPRRTDE